MSLPTPGQKVRFIDSTATVSDAEPTIAQGTVNGEPVLNRDTGEMFVPVFAERDNGREPTTVYVAKKNLLAAAA